MGEIVDLTPTPYCGVDLSWIVGRTVTDVSLLEPLPWRFHLGDSARLDVECLWRIAQGNSVLLTSEDHGQQFGLPAVVDALHCARKLLLQKPIVGVRLQQPAGDLRISLGACTELEIISTSSGYESWQVQGPGGRCYVAQGGGQICTWVQLSWMRPTT
jgi:hypothetical protein